MNGVKENLQVTTEYDTGHRRYYDTVTWLAEVMPGSMRTSFEYEFNGYDLIAEDGSLVGEFFRDGINEAINLPHYEQRRRQIEMGEYHDMIGMAEGRLPNTMVVLSDFPPELMNATTDVGGYNVQRKQTMMRVFTRTDEGKIRMVSQSLDGSNRQALENIFYTLGHVPQEGELLGQRIHLDLPDTEGDFLIDKLTGIYDRSLSSQFGGDWYAGILENKRANTYDFVRQQEDLINAYLASTYEFSGGLRDLQLAAAIRDRFMGTSQKPFYYSSNALSVPVAAHALAVREMELAGERAIEKREIFSGCGFSIGGGMNAGEQLSEAGIGNKSNKEGADCEFVSKKCPECKKKNVKTKVTKTHISGSCGCRVKR